MATKRTPIGRTLKGADRENFSERLSQMIEAAGFATMKEFCLHAGIDPGMMSRFRTGARAASTPTLTRIASALSVSVDQLLGVEGDSLSILERAVGQLALENPTRATEFAAVAKSLSFDSPEFSDVEKVKNVLRGLAGKKSPLDERAVTSIGDEGKLGQSKGQG